MVKVSLCLVIRKINAEEITYLDDNNIVGNHNCALRYHLPEYKPVSLDVLYLNLV